MSQTTRDSVSTEAYPALVEADPVLRDIVRRHGWPDPFSWPGGGDASLTNFEALVLHIISQQLSTKVAKLLYGRMVSVAGGQATPATLARLGVAGLHGIGLSRAKSVSIVDLSELHLTEDLDTAHLESLDDEAVISTLTTVKGVGPWTAEMFLIHQLRRPDVLPAGDLGIRKAVRAQWGLEALPSVDDVRALGAPWAPYRTYASALLWTSVAPADESSDR